MLLSTDSAIPLDAELSVHCVLDGQERLHAIGKVVRKDEGRNELGIAFGQMSPEVEASLRRALDQFVALNEP
jgi:hypothetical protein